MAKWYYGYTHDCGGRVLDCHAIVEADGVGDALLKGQEAATHYCGHSETNACFRVPDSMQDWDDGRILEQYRNVKFGAFGAPQFTTPE